MKTALTGIIHGRTIQLDNESGLPDGQPVNVTLEPASPCDSAQDAAVREALRRAAGSWSDDIEGLDRYLDWNRQQRKVARPEIPE
jgi:hypothetical protein